MSSALHRRPLPMSGLHERSMIVQHRQHAVPVIDRPSKVDAVRAQLDAGRYDADSKLGLAADRMIAREFREFTVDGDELDTLADCQTLPLYQGNKDCDDAEATENPPRDRVPEATVVAIVVSALLVIPVVAWLMQ